MDTAIWHQPSDVKVNGYNCLLFTAGPHPAHLQSLRCGSRYLKNRNIKCGSEASELLWLLLVTFSSGIWQQAHGRAQLFDEYFKSQGPKDRAGRMLPSVLWNDNVASLKQDSEATELPFIAARNITNMEEPTVCVWCLSVPCIFSLTVSLPWLLSTGRLQSWVCLCS